MNRIKLGFLGCGKVTENFHLPVAMQTTLFEPVCLVDAYLPRAEFLGKQYGIAQVFTDYRRAFDHVDAVILATPNHLHAPMAVDLLKNGINVLVEKPMALTAVDCEAMLQAEKDSGCVLSIGLIRRFYATSQFVKQVIDSRLLGEIREFDFQEGGIFSWKVTSDFMFRKEAGGGVLADIGVHTLDLLLWWLGEVDNVSYMDDAQGGVEADCMMRLNLKNGASGHVALSRLRKMRNTFIIAGERGALEVGNNFDADIKLSVQDRKKAIKGRAFFDSISDQSMHQVFLKQLNNFAAAINGVDQPFVTGVEGQRAVKMIETCLKDRKFLETPWSVSAIQEKAC